MKNRIIRKCCAFYRQPVFVLVMIACLPGHNYVSPARAQQSASPAIPQITDVTLQEKEILLDGEITSVDFTEKLMVLSATSFTLPGGKTSRIAPAKPKTVLLDDKTMLLSTRGLQLGEQPWANAHVGMSFLDAGGKVMGYGMIAELNTDSDWTQVSVQNTLPANTSAVLIDTGNWGRAGTVMVDDIVIEANPAVESVGITKGMPEGTFEKLDKNGLPVGWNWSAKTGVEVVEENGNRFLRLTNTAPDKSVGDVIGFFRLDPDCRMVRVRSRIRTRDIKPGKQPWEIARLGYIFTDDMGLRIGDYTNSPGINYDTDWKVVEVVAPVHTGATRIKLQPILQATTGVLDIDDILVEPVLR